ncbi:hypothetical protein AB0H42_34085 [Nocardia sp. NPDC050799]|uniref:hypothetical protein n=1 Tax=Nocardia sp. NPDC050799 TaxID=3154842 RepID=UPI0033EFB2DB
MTELPRAAYIPIQPEHGYNRAVELAIAFLDHVDARGTIVVVPQKNTLTFCAPLNTYAKGRPVLTPKNSNQSGIGYGRPALVYAPGQRELALATEFARNAPIAVVEDAGFSSSRWADEIGAVNLIEKRIHAVDRSAEHQQLLERIEFAGNNGWGDAYGLRDLRHLLGELQERSLLDKDEVLAYLIVHGKAHHYDALVRVGKEIDKVQAS